MVRGGCSGRSRESSMPRLQCLPVKLGKEDASSGPVPSYMPQASREDDSPFGFTRQGRHAPTFILEPASFTPSLPLHAPSFTFTFTTALLVTVHRTHTHTHRSSLIEPSVCACAIFHRSYSVRDISLSRKPSLAQPRPPTRSASLLSPRSLLFHSHDCDRSRSRLLPPHGTGHPAGQGSEGEWPCSFACLLLPTRLREMNCRINERHRA